MGSQTMGFICVPWLLLLLPSCGFTQLLPQFLIAGMPGFSLALITPVAL